MIPMPAFSTAIAVLAGLAGFTAGYTFEHRARVAEVAQIRADIAGWILDAAALYEQCRARIDALRQWDEMTNQR